VGAISRLATKSGAPPPDLHPQLDRSAVQEAQPEGIRDASCRLPDGVTYVALLQIDDGVENPLAALTEFREFQEGLKGWLAENPSPEQMTVVGSYRFFD
jgi:hypothetical protein